MKAHYRKPKKQLPFKSRSHTWHAASGSNDNLVISFSEDDSESEHEDSRPEGHDKKQDDAVTTDWLQRSTSTSNLRTNLSQKSLNNKTRDPHGRSSVNSLVSMNKKVTGSITTATGKRSSHENEALKNKCDPQNSVDNFQQEITLQPKDLRSHKSVNRSKKRLLGIHEDICEPTNKNSEVQTMVKRHIVDDPVRMSIDEKDVKRLKVREDSHIKLTGNGLLNETQRPISQNDMHLQIDDNISHPSSAQTSARAGIQHDVNNGIVLVPSNIVADREKAAGPGSGYHIVGTTTAIVRNGDACFVQGGHHSSGIDMSSSHNQLNMMFAQLNSAGRISDLQRLTPDMEDASIGQSKLLLESLLGASQINQSAMLSFPGYDFMDIDSLMKLEELKDKELEEAQEVRHKCELAERQALKAYREAQRALVDANERCSLLYRRRELFSAHIRSLVMDGGNSLLSPGWSSRARTQMESAERVTKASRIPSPAHGYNMVGKNLRGSQSDAKSGGDACEAEHRGRHVESTSQLLLGHSSKFELLSSPNVGGSDTGYNGVLVGRSHPSNSHNMPIRDGRFFLACSNSNDSRLVCEEENLGGEMGSLNIETGKISSGQNSQDLELEAALRSKLCARFSKKPSVVDHGQDQAPVDECKGDGGPYIEKESGTQMKGLAHLSNDVPLYEKSGTTQMKGQTNFSTDVPSYEKNSILIGVDNLREIKQSLSMPPDQQVSSGCFSEGTCERDHTSVSSVFLSTLAIVSRHLKFILPEPIHEKQTHTISSDQFVNAKDVTSYGMRMSRTISTGSYHCDLVVDPLWPLCMFDLRGRCNDQECQWQHLRDCKSVEQDIIKHNASNSDALKGLSVMNASKSSRGVNGSTVFIPTYRIGSNLVKAGKLQFESLLARSNWHYWQMSFSTSFFLPFSIQRPQPSDAPLLQGFGDHADHDNSKRQLLSPLNQEKIMKLIAHGMTDLEQALELAIDLFNTKTNKTLGRKKALSVLSRSLEANPSSTVLWIAYLSIYYRKEKDLGDDDMFLLSVQHNENSYDLWLMYINSRMQFDSRMDAYDEALHALCHKQQTNNSKDGYLSACILDLFVQMVDFLCMSGNAEILTPRIYGLLDSLKDSESLATMLLIDIISCLVTTDRCIFWICCIYFVMYKKLPEVIIQQIESEKGIPFEMEWPIVQLTNGKKHLPMELMRMALDNLDLAPDMAHGDDCSRRTNERSAQFIAVSHVRFVAAIEGSESYVPLLDRYINKYPTCIELIKMAAHCHNLLRCDLSFEYFEQALRDWPRKTPGIQCLWNQYAAYALDCKRLDVGEELMVRWFCSFCKYQNQESGKGVESGLSSSVGHIPRGMKNRDCSLSSSVDLPFLTLEGDGYSYNQDDVMFGFLNLFLYYVMQNDKEKACASIERALKEAPTHYYAHCVREHSSFHLANTVSSGGMNSNMVLTLLDGYLGDIRCSPQSQLLSRRDCQYLKKPRLKHLIDSLLGPFSLDCSLLNSILYECYGPSLLPKKLVEPKALVDNVEHLIEMFPANYKLAISACKCACKVSEHAGVAASGLMFWASTLLVNAILQSSPVAPEHVWLEAAELLSNLEDHRISERFLQQGLSAYPFSKKLWQSYYRLSKIIGVNPSYVVEASRERGINLT